MGALKYYCYLRQDIMDSDRIYQLINQAEELVQAGEYKLAISVFQQVLQIDPHNIEALRQYGKYLTQIREFEQAFKAFKQAIEIAPTNVKLLSSYSTFLKKLGKNAQLIDIINTLIEIEPQNCITLAKSANTLASIGEYDNAFQLFEQSLQIEPNNPKTLASYANALASIGEYDNAFQLFEQSLQIEPNNPKTLASYANALASIGEYDNAFQLFEQSLQIEPNNPIRLSRYAIALAAIGEYEQAFELFELSLEIEPQNPITLSKYANILAEIGKYEQAFELFELSLEIEPQNLITLSRYAIALTAIGKYEKAVQLFEQCLQIKFQNSDALNSYIYLQYALALEGLGKYKDAIEQLLTIKVETQTQYQANLIRVKLGRLYYRIKQPEKGSEYFEAAIANSDDKDKTVIYSARSILSSDPHSETAIELLQQIAKNSPRYAQAFEMLTLNLSEEDYFDMVKTDAQTGLIDTTEMLNRAMYHKIANEIGILKGIAYRILRYSEQEDPLLRGIIQDIEDVFEEVNRRRAAQKSAIETIPHDDYGKILAVISKTAHDISDFVNNQLAVIESKTRRAIRKLKPSDAHYAQFEKLLAQLELTQTALSDLKAINEGITIKNHRFKVKKLFEKWETTPRIDQAQIILDIQNGDSEFNGDEEKIKSTLNELVENSLKHNYDQQDLRICISSQDVINPSVIWERTIPGEQKYLFIEFADNGKGIPKDKKHWIFQPLKTTSQEGKGSGLGLFIIRKTLTKMNGYIRETGYNGARFEIYIPYTKGELH
ncbi:tetratricopeptide repeat protein [Nostoc sp. FACHB-87]|uniref:tetratricopeptide repeat protein n=1 Tax=Nostoc sp. FACHB-87 TaxID=2692841 RepID=UPI0016825BF0|nr:tetratricopeptide repeat protein [Nostoc sp. FACHB-87]MBD2453666.1 tetratricopeptide repeat protein [Nostoc sp. FACHB-87]